MAGDWIKWTKGFAKKPEVLRMAGILGLSRKEVAGSLMELWEWCDDNVTLQAQQNGNDNSAFVTLGDNATTLIDGIVGHLGFADAMTAVGWLKSRHGSLEFPNFGRHNLQPAKQRALAAKRMQSLRATTDTDLDTKTPEKRCARSATREEKKREEKKEELPPFPPEIDCQEFKDAWQRYTDYRRENRLKPLKLSSVKTQWKRLAGWGVKVAVEAIDHSIANGWQGIFPPGPADAPPSANGKHPKPSSSIEDKIKSFRAQEGGARDP